MKGLTLKALQAIEKLIDSHFDSISLKLLGIIPKINKEKMIVFTTNRNSLTSLFLQALGTRSPNKSEEDALKIILRVTSSYIESLKAKTKANIIHEIDAYLKKSPNLQSSKLQLIYQQEMDKTKQHLKKIVATESNKVKNVGTALQITKVAQSQGIEDPTVFFIVTKDAVTCKECKRLHLLPDGVTPRVWKLSELGNEYHKRGDKNSKIGGLHSNCRCYLSYLSPGWGFNQNGSIVFKGIGWNEYQFQKKNRSL